jgi:hypothetical protein
MIRGIRLVLGGLAILAATSGEARSQYYYPYGYGYGGSGFGGWGGTPQGNFLQGLGAYAEGAGVYNYDSATARSINVDTAIRLNQYIWNSELEARQLYNTHLARRMSLSNDQYKIRQKQMRAAPLSGDIESGEALNLILFDLTDPRVMSNSSALRMADASVSARTIREIPFRDETDAITISLDQLTDPKSWPTPLRAEVFAPEREAYQKAIDDALAEDKEGGTLKPETVARVRNAVATLYRKVDATIPKSQQPDHLDSINYLKGLAGLSRMLERPNVESVLSELEKIENTTIGNLVAFMHTYNLRFGTATTPKQKAAYRDLYPLMVAARDKVLGKPQGDTEPTPATPVDNPTAIFYGLDPAHLHPKTAPSSPTPTPPAPANPTPPKP